MKNSITFPGTVLATSEEGAASRGTFDSDGTIISTVAGKSGIDSTTYDISVTPFKQVTPLRAGDLVKGLVHDIYDTVALVEFLPVGNKDRKAVSNRMAYLRISEVSRDYVENFRDVLRIGDVILARVKEVKPLGIYLSIIDRDLGVIAAKCTYCRRELAETGRGLVCPNCGSREQRKVAVAAAKV